MMVGEKRRNRKKRERSGGRGRWMLTGGPHCYCQNNCHVGAILAKIAFN